MIQTNDFCDYKENKALPVGGDNSIGYVKLNRGKEKKWSGRPGAITKRNQA